MPKSTQSRKAAAADEPAEGSATRQTRARRQDGLDDHQVNDQLQAEAEADVDEIEDTHTTATRLAQLAQLSESTRYGAGDIPPFNIDPAVSVPPTDITEMLAKIVEQNQQLADAVRTSKRDHEKMEREFTRRIDSLQAELSAARAAGSESGDGPKTKKAKVKVTVSNKCKNVVQHYFNYHLGKTYATKPKKIDFEPGMIREWPEPTEEGQEVVVIGGVERTVYRPPWGTIGTRLAGMFQNAVLSSAREDCGGEFSDDELAQAFATYYGNASNAYRAEQTVEGRAAKAQRMRKNRRLQRQIAMLGRRVRAFETSPHNKSRERDLLKAALLNIATVPELTSDDEDGRLYVHTYDDGSKAELEKEHYIRSQFGAHMPGTRYVECRDIAWLDDDMRTKAYLLDEWANHKIGSGDDQSPSQRFNPSTVYHVPRARWARCSPPEIRARDDQGNPVEDKGGSVIIYRGTVSPDVHEAWVEELYDPPTPTAGSLALRPFNEVIRAASYTAIVTAVAARRKAIMAPVIDPQVLIEEDMDRNTKALAGLRT